MKRFLRIVISVTGLFIRMGLHLINTHHLSFIMLLRFLYSEVACAESAERKGKGGGGGGRGEKNDIVISKQLICHA